MAVHHAPSQADIRNKMEAELLMLLDAEDKEACEESLYHFIKAAWHVVEPGKKFYDNWHIEAICLHLEAAFHGMIKRLMINIPPRHMKSTICAVMFPVWCWIKRPGTQFLYASYAHNLSIRDSVKARRLIQSAWFQQRWGDKFKLTSDQNTKIRYDNDHNGYRIATSVDGQATGEGGDIIVVDDAHNVKETPSDTQREAVLEWWDQSMQTRLNDFNTGVFIVIMQRIHEHDLCGHILSSEADDIVMDDEDNLEWDHLCFPARFELDHPHINETSLGFFDPRTEEGELLWPNRMKEGTLRRLERKLGSYGTAGQLQQRPSPKGGGILKEEHWQCWDYKDNQGKLMMPTFKYILHSWDTAYSAEDDAAYSARTTWGIFEHHTTHGTPYPCVMILGRWRKRVRWNDLRKEAVDRYNRDKPDAVLIEKKASGQSLIQDLRISAGIPCLEYSPDRDKVARAWTVTPIFEAGQVWYPADRQWAKDVIDMCAAFPAGDGADIVDTCTQALIRLRNMWFFFRDEDAVDEEEDQKQQSEQGKAVYG